MTTESDLRAAEEMVRRAHKGLPVDRWFSGDDGAYAVVRGIEALWQGAAEAVARCDALEAERREAGLAAMEVSRDPMR